MRKVLFISVISLTSLFSCKMGTKEVSSPDNKISVKFYISEDKKAYYDILFEDSLVLNKSRLGIIMEDADFSENLKLVSASPVEMVIDSYIMLHGKEKDIVYQANKLAIHLESKAGGKMDIIFQVSNDGVAFRYGFPGEAKDVKSITKEITSF